MKRIYLVRHCKATGQEVDAPLTEEGFEQAEQLADFLAEKSIDRVIASEYLRAQQTVIPFAKRNGLEVEVDTGLGEYVLSGTPMADWLEKLQAAFEDADLSYEGGESMRSALVRGMAVVNRVLESDSENIVLVSHGGMTTLLLRAFDDNYGFHEWKALSNPDVYLVTVGEAGEKRAERLWR